MARRDETAIGSAGVAGPGKSGIGGARQDGDWIGWRGLARSGLAGSGVAGIGWRGEAGPGLDRNGLDRLAWLVQERLG